MMYIGTNLQDNFKRIFRSHVPLQNLGDEAAEKVWESLPCLFGSLTGECKGPVALDLSRSRMQISSLISDGQADVCSQLCAGG